MYPKYLSPLRRLPQPEVCLDPHIHYKHLSQGILTETSNIGRYISQWTLGGIRQTASRDTL